MLGPMMSRVDPASFEQSGKSEQGETLPLFAESAPVAGSEEQTLDASPRPAVESDADRHLRAATRLAKAIRRLPERSAQQVKTGRAICRHLIALLEGEPGRNSEKQDQRH